MRTFEFSIIASGLDNTADDFEQRFYDAGCDGAGVGFQRGRIIIDFAREAASIDEAIASAVECVRKTGATVERVEPDYLVNLADIAERVGQSRQALSLYARGERQEGFPLPVARITTSAPLYDWSDVAAWFHRRGQLSREAWVEALAVKTANALLDVPHIGTVLKERMREAQKCEPRAAE